MSQQDRVGHQAEHFIAHNLEPAVAEALEGGWKLYHVLVEHIFRDAAAMDETAPLGFFDSLMALAMAQRKSG